MIESEPITGSLEKLWASLPVTLLKQTQLQGGRKGTQLSTRTKSVRKFEDDELT